MWVGKSLLESSWGVRLMQLVKGGLFYSWGKHTMPLTNMCSNWMLIASSGLEITFICSLFTVIHILGYNFMWILYISYILGFTYSLSHIMGCNMGTEDTTRKSVNNCTIWRWRARAKTITHTKTCLSDAIVYAESADSPSYPINHHQQIVSVDDFATMTNGFHHNHMPLLAYLVIKLSEWREILEDSTCSIKGDRATLLCALNANSSIFPLEWWWLQGYLLFFCCCWLLGNLQVMRSTIACWICSYCACYSI